MGGNIYSYRLNEGVPEGSLQSFCVVNFNKKETLLDINLESLEY